MIITGFLTTDEHGVSMLNRQEIFDRVASHLLSQNATSYDERIGPTMGCRYRGDNGRKCAVGCLIEEQHYNRSLEGKSVLDNVVRRALYKSGIDCLGGNGDDTVNMLVDLQRMHDGVEPQLWRDQLSGYAEKYHLQVNFN